MVNEVTEWFEKRLDEIAEFNPRESLSKGSIAKKISMDKLQPFCRDVPEFELEPYSGGTKFRNGDTIMARITPCLENGKTAKVSVLEDGEVGFGSTEYIVFRAKDGCDPDFLYYLVTSPIVRGPAIKSMVGSSGRQRVQTDVLQTLLVKVPDLEEQKSISGILKSLDDKIAANRMINDNLQQQAASIFTKWLITRADASTIGDMSYNILDYSPVGSEQIRLLNSSDVTEGVFPIAPLVPNKDLKGHFKKRFKFGDILYSEIRPRNHHYGFVLFDASDYIASTRLMVIRAIENKVSPAMLYQYLLLPEVEAEFTLKTESRSGTFPQGNYADMASIRVPYSPTDSQVAISETLTQIRYTIAQNQLESQRLAELRDTLLPKLMSGELDVSAVEL